MNDKVKNNEVLNQPIQSPATVQRNHTSHRPFSPFSLFIKNSSSPLSLNVPAGRCSLVFFRTNGAARHTSDARGQQKIYEERLKFLLIHLTPCEEGPGVIMGLEKDKNALIRPL